MKKIKRTYLRASVIAAMAGMIILVAMLACVGSASATDWHVNEGESIQAAIDNAADGDTVIVHGGTYEEQLYIAKSLDLKAAEDESPEIWAPEPEELESYVYDFEIFPGFVMPISVTQIIMVNGSFNDISVDITGFVINGSSVTPENSEDGICGIVYLNADGTIESNEIKNIWGLVVEEEPPHVYNGMNAFVYSNSSNTVTIHGNTLYDETGVGSGGGVAICVMGGGTETRIVAAVTENIIIGAKSPGFPDTGGVLIYNAIATVNDNIVNGYICTDELLYASGISAGLTDLTAQGNTLIGGGIWVSTYGCGLPPSTVFIEGNTIDASGVSEDGCGLIAGIAITASPQPCGSYGEEPSLTAIVEGNQLIGGPGSGIVIGGIGEMTAELGIDPVGTVTATITRNNVSSWDCGIELLNCSNSTVYLNDFVDNVQNVFVNESANTYSSPEKLGYTYEGRDYTNYVGNYWSDYEGEDVNADGIGDTPYDINSSDDYPLMERNENYEQIGILVVAHGSPRESWCKPVREAVENVSMGYPTEVGFLEFVEDLEGYDFIHEAVDKLDEKGVTKIIAVPLFISSHSGHIAEIEYVLGLRETLPEHAMTPARTFVEGVEMERYIVSREGQYHISYMPISDDVSAMGASVKQHGGEEEEELVPVDTPAEIVLTNAIDDHSLIAQILADRAAEVCENPKNETVVIVGHGTDEEEFFPGWVNSSESLAEKVKLMLRHSKGIDIEDVKYSFVFPPEDYPVNLTVRAVVENVSTNSHPIVVPLMVSEGFFTDRYIPYMLLAELDYAYPEKGKRALTPHDNVANWIEVTAAKEFVYPTVLIYDEEELQEISLAEVGAHHGEICPCVAFAFRSMLRAFSEEELWDGIPHRGDVKIISANPSDGHNITYEYILNSTEDVVIELPPGTDIINITADNYVYTFINKSTNESVTLCVKEDIFPERFFELRTKKKLGIATPEEKKAFKLLWEKLKEKALYKPVDRVFEEVELGTSFETGEGTYPSIFGVHEGTITPLHNVIADKMCTYPCKGTGGHSKYIRIYNESRTIAEAHWNGYTGDYHNISFDTMFILEAGKKYNYTIRTGSYPQIHHTDRLKTSDGVIECTQFVDANGKSHDDWIPAIRLF